MTFTGKGELVYDIIDGDKLQRMNMVYRTDGGIIYSNQPSHPREEQTRYHFENNNTLVLDYEGDITKYTRL